MGIGMDIHFCMNERVGAEFFSNDHEKCQRCGMTEKETGCCHDEHKFFKLEIPAKQVSCTSTFDFLKKSWAIATNNFLYVTDDHIYPDYSSDIQPLIAGYQPPPLYIFQCVYRL